MKNVMVHELDPLLPILQSLSSDDVPVPSYCFTISTTAADCCNTTPPMTLNGIARHKKRMTTFSCVRSGCHAGRRCCRKAATGGRRTLVGRMMGGGGTTHHAIQRDAGYNVSIETPSPSPSLHNTSLTGILRLLCGASLRHDALRRGNGACTLECGCSRHGTASARLDSA